MSHLPIILFDFDGVIITQKSLEYAASVFIKKKFYHWKNIENLRLIDFARIFEEADSKNRIKAFIRIMKVYKQYIPSSWRRILFFIKFRRTYPKYEKYETINPNLEEVLLKFRRNNFVLGIVSNTNGKRLSQFKYKLNLEDFFSVFISRDDSPSRKPSAVPIFAALKEIKKQLKVPIVMDSIYYIGDLPHDIVCAKNAGIKSIALLSGHGTKQGLEESNPTYLLPNVKNIIEIEDIKKFLLK